MEQTKARLKLEETLKRWRHGPGLIPDQHEPGKQRGYFGSPKKKGRKTAPKQGGK